MSNTQSGMKMINETRDAARGYVAVNACAAGWPSLLSVHMGRVAEPAITTRLMTGVEASDAIAQSVLDVELMAAMDVFAQAMAKNATPEQALEVVLKLRSKTLGDFSGTEQVIEAATAGFKSALEYGMTPFAALIAANIMASSAMRLLTKNDSDEQSIN